MKQLLLTRRDHNTERACVWLRARERHFESSSLFAHAHTRREQFTRPECTVCVRDGVSVRINLSLSVGSPVSPAQHIDTYRFNGEKMPHCARVSLSLSLFAHTIQNSQSNQAFRPSSLITRLMNFLLPHALHRGYLSSA